MKKRIYTLFVIVGLIGSSCDSLLEINPRQSIDSSAALTTAEGANAALSDVYAYLKDVTQYGRDFVATSEALADNARIINRAGGRYVNAGSNVLFTHYTNWQTAYAGINQANLLLEAIPTIKNVTDQFKDQLKGQALGLRALFYFNLMRAYSYEPNLAPTADMNKGGVPLEVTAIISEDQIEKRARASQSEIYTKIYADLNEAAALAPDGGAPQYITKAAAHALLAKVALYNQDYALAESEATAALSIKGTLTSNANYIAAWRASVHDESIFEVLFKNVSENIGTNESVQSAFTTRVSLTSSTLGGYGAVVPTTAFLNLFQASDVRKQLYQNGVSRSAVIAVECTKFLGKNGTPFLDNIPVIRVSEVYLIRAEARARQGSKDAQALTDLNSIVVRAGNPALVGLSGTALINAIIDERRLELAFEGERWFDLKRLGRDVIKTTGNVVYATDGRMLANIPLRDIQANTLLVQNPGY